MASLSEASHPISERRLHARQRMISLAYVDLGKNNGGIVLDICEGGLAVQAVVGLAGDELPFVRFQLPQSRDWIRAHARIAWISESKKEGGVEFIELAEEDRTRLREWIASNASPDDLSSERQVAPCHNQQPTAAPNPSEQVTAGESRMAEVVAQSADQDPSPAPESPLGVPRPPDNGTKPGGVGPAREPAISTPGFEAPGVFAGRQSPDARAAAMATLPARKAENSRPGATARVPNIFDREHGPEFRLFGQTAAWPERPRKRPRWLLVVGLVVILAGLSFIGGKMAGQGDFGGGMLGAINALQAKSANLWNSLSQRGATAPATGQGANTTPAPSAGGASNAQTPASNVPPATEPGRYGQPSSPAGAAAGQTTPNEHSAQNSGYPRDSAASDTGNDATSWAPTESNSDGFSGLVAITSRLSIPIPPGAGAQAPPAAESLRVGQLEHRVIPVYPQEAIEDWIEGTVKLRAKVGPDGAVEDVEVISGHLPLANAATDAVRQWRYQPTLLDGRPIETEEDVALVFRLPRTPSRKSPQ